MEVWLRPISGSFGFIAFGYWLHIKAPWNEALFSERYGFNKWRGCFGWRWQFRELERPTADNGGE